LLGIVPKIVLCRLSLKLIGPYYIGTMPKWGILEEHMPSNEVGDIVNKSIRKDTQFKYPFLCLFILFKIN